MNTESPKSDSIVTPEMVKVGLDAACQWEEDNYELNDWVPEPLIEAILEAVLSRHWSGENLVPSLGCKGDVRTL